MNHIAKLAAHCATSHKKKKKSLKKTAALIKVLEKNASGTGFIVKFAEKKDSRLVNAGVSDYNTPKKTSHPKKSHIVVAKHKGQVKTIRFGQQGVATNQTKGQREAFKSRHRKNIARGPMSAAYWADKVKWSPKDTKDKKNKKWVKGS